MVPLKLKIMHTDLFPMQISVISNSFAYLRCCIAKFHCNYTRKQEQLETCVHSTYCFCTYLMFSEELCTQ